MNDWDVVNEQIDKSKIPRISWRRLLGESLTVRILRLRNKGHTSSEVKDILIRTIQIKKYIEDNPHLKERILNNINISVSARYGESKTAENVRKYYDKNGV